jgi:hypothetical protein
MSPQDAFITLLNASIETAVEHKQTALSLRVKAESLTRKELNKHGILQAFG